MKPLKNLLWVLCFFSLSAALSAQNPNPFRFGLKASPNVGWFKPDTKGIDGNGTKIGFNYGLMAEFALGGSYNYGIGTGVEVASYGGELQYKDVAPVDTFATSVNSSTYTTNYLEIPFTIRMKTNEIGYTTYFANFGLNTGFRLKASQDESHDVNGTTITEEDNDILKQVQPLRLGMNLGAGVEYNFHGNTALVVGITFNNGFTNIFKTDYYELDSNGDVLPKKQTVKQKANSRYVSLDVGVFF